MSELKGRDVVTAASIIADRYLVGLKVEDIKEAMVSRSEERRVGKECRTRWSPDHEKERRGGTGG